MTINGDFVQKVDFLQKNDKKLQKMCHFLALLEVQKPHFGRQKVHFWHEKCVSGRHFSIPKNPIGFGTPKSTVWRSKPISFRVKSALPGRTKSVLGDISPIPKKRIGKMCHSGRVWQSHVWTFACPPAHSRDISAIPKKRIAKSVLLDAKSLGIAYDLLSYHTDRKALDAVVVLNRCMSRPRH